jgi:hypothetical protein
VIRCQGPIVQVTLNNEQIIIMDVDLWSEAGKNPDGSPNKFGYAWSDVPRRGHLAFQDHSPRGDRPARVWYRNVKIRPL